MNMHLTNSDTIQVQQFTDPQEYLRYLAQRKNTLRGEAKVVNIAHQKKMKALDDEEAKRQAEQAVINAEISALEKEVRSLEKLNKLRREIIQKREEAEDVELQTLPYSMSRIMAKFCRLFKVKPTELTGRRNNARVVFVRQAIIYWTIRMTGMSYPAIAMKMGGRDHTVMLHAAAIYPFKRKQMGRTIRAVNNYKARPVTHAWMRSAFIGKHPS